MLYRKMPKTGEELSILGFGCMRLPQRDGRIDEEKATGLVRNAIDRGVNYIDTAWPYHAGESEPFVGRALAGGYRELVKLATKLPSWMVAGPADFDRFLEAQLRKLATDHIDYYLVHSVRGELWDRLAEFGVVEFLDRALADDRIGNAGFSYHGSREDFRRVVDAYPWTFCQIQYNFLDEDTQAGTEGLKYAAARGLGVVVMEPLRGGTLAMTPPPAVDAVWQQAEHRRTPAEWALRWVWDHPEVTVALSGMNEDAQVEENLQIAGDAHAGSLSIEETGLIAKAARTLRAAMKAGCTGCGYCQPCPSGVDIPGSLDLLNLYYTFGKVNETPFLYVLRAGGALTGKPSYASLCSHCGDCVTKCPQNLEIPDLLEEVVALFESDGLREREVAVRKLFHNG